MASLYSCYEALLQTSTSDCLKCLNPFYNLHVLQKKNLGGMILAKTRWVFDNIFHQLVFSIL